MKVLIAGSSGLVGSALVRLYKNLNHHVIGVNTKNLDLFDREATFKFIADCNPDLIIDAAAKAGGIQANNLNPTKFLSENLRIQCNLMDAAANARIEKFVFLGSSCIYPRDCKQPIKEEYLLTGHLEPTNSAYAIAKIAGIEGIKAVRKQLGLKWISLMPTNVYGSNDNFNLESSHVLPAILRKIVEAKEDNLARITLWGDGSSLREFIYADDLASATEFAVRNYDSNLHLNVGTQTEFTIRDLAEIISKKVGFEGEIAWDLTKPNGTPRKVLDSSRIYSLGWKPNFDLDRGVDLTLKWYLRARKEGTVRL